MKAKLFFIAAFLLSFNVVQSQDASIKKFLNELFARIDPSGNSDSITKETMREMFKLDALNNDLVFKNLQNLIQPHSKTYKFLRDLNLKPKMFQVDSSAASLGFEYKYENSWSKFKKTGEALFIQDYAVSFAGNIAFRKNLNPNNFSESFAGYTASFNWGGMPMEIDDATSDKIQALEDSILERRKRKQPYMDLYKQVNSLIKVSDQFYAGVKAKFALENNQDFSKMQFAPGVILGFGAKGWNENEALRYFNILDYPFALIRMLTGTDEQFTVYGSSFPSFLIGWDYIIPQKDTVRKKITGDDKPFNRLRFEAAFKTRIARIGKEVFNFSADYRWYQEINASQSIRLNQLAFSNFFVAAIESNTGLFVSYTTGKLPFDRKNDQVYSLGFKYDLGNSK